MSVMLSRHSFSPWGMTFVVIFLLWLLFRREQLLFISSSLPVFSSENPFKAYIWGKDLPPDPPDNLAPLAQLCASTEWVPDRVWQCEHVHGGISNVYNVFLHCVRIAIEAGATSLIPPRIWIRSTDNPAILITANLTDLSNPSYLFDYSHFKKSLATACPRMKIYDSPKSVPGMPQDPRYTALHPIDLGDPGGFRRKLDDHLAGVTHWASGGYHPRAYDYILQACQFYWWPVYGDNEQAGLGDTLQSILHFRQDARSLAAEVLAILQSNVKPLRTSTEAQPVPFLGAHLRTGKDLGDEWSGTGRDEQFEDYMAIASAHNFDLMYLASGAPLDVDYFVDRAAQEYPDVTITTKQILLVDSPALLRRLNAMSNDQQAIVDFEVLGRADRFAGMHRSSFDWQLALRRHRRSDVPLAECLRHERHMFENEYDTILNAEPQQWFDIFFYHTWP